MSELPTARIDAAGGVYIDGVKMPGLIAERGVTVRPGGELDVTVMTVEFLVGAVTVDDPWGDDTCR